MLNSIYRFKLVIITFFIFILSINNLKAETVNEIIVEGNNRVSQETVIMFSGVSKDGPYGAWLDSHAPPKEIIQDDSYRDELLLDRNEIASCVNELADDPIEYIGIKIGAPPGKSSIAERCRLNAESLLQLKSW